MLNSPKHCGVSYLYERYLEMTWTSVPLKFDKGKSLLKMDSLAFFLSIDKGSKESNP